MKKITIQRGITDKEIQDLIRDNDLQFPLDINYMLPKDSRAKIKYPIPMWNVGSWGYENKNYLTAGIAFSNFTNKLTIEEMNTVELHVQEFTRDEYIIYVTKHGGKTGGPGDYRLALQFEIGDYYDTLKSKQTQE